MLTVSFHLTYIIILLANPGSRRQSESARTVSQTSTIGGDYDSYPEDLEEPFSDSDDESRAPEKMSLALPKGRIRFYAYSFLVTCVKNAFGNRA